MSDRTSQLEAPSEETVSAALLDALRVETGLQFGFVEQPARLQRGLDTFTYTFRVASRADPTGPFSRPLVLRLFREESDRVRASQEFVIQNAVAGVGESVPRVLLHVDDPGIEGRPFLVMERVRGRPMSDALQYGAGDRPTLTDWLAAVHAGLHDVSAIPVIEAVEDLGLTTSAFSIWYMLDSLDPILTDPRFAKLRPARDWLRNNRPSEREIPAVCHGDFHPENIMVDGGRVSGVLDWSNAKFGDAEYDVAVTLVLMGIIVPALFPETRPYLRDFRSDYLRAYGELRMLDDRRLSYYEAMRAFVGLVWGIASVTPDVSRELLPVSDCPWTDEWIRRQQAERIEAITGLALDCLPRSALPTVVAKPRAR